jgi:O-antigen/teichoic acid export membrane protein
MTKLPIFSSNLLLRLRHLGVEFLWIALGQILTILGSLVGLRLLTNVLSPGSYGEIALALTVTALLNELVSGPLSSAATRFFPIAIETRQLVPFLRDIRNLLAKTTWGVLIAAGLASFIFLLTGQSLWVSILVPLVIFSLVGAYNNIINGMQNLVRQRKIVAWHQALGTWARYGMAALLVIWLGDSSSAALAGYALASILVLGSQLYFFRRLLQKMRFSAQVSEGVSLSGVYATKMLKYALPFMLTGIFVFAQSVSDKWALQLFGTTQEVGYYAVLYQVGYFPMILIGGMLTQLFIPIYFTRIGDATDAVRVRQANQLNSWLLVGTLAVTAGISFAAIYLKSFIFSIVVGPDYRAMSVYLPLMLLCGGGTVAVQWVVLFFMGQRRTREIAAPNAIINTMGIILHGVGAYAGGIFGLICGKLLFITILIVALLARLKKDGSKLSPRQSAGIVY